jgi:MFS family permease
MTQPVEGARGHAFAIPEPSTDRPPDRAADPRESGGDARPSRSRGPFRRIAFVLAVNALGAGVPTPLYAVYEQQMGFGSGTLGLIFAAYALGVVLAMFFIAPLADAIGPNRILYLGMVLTALGGVVFLVASSPGVLAVARVVSGLSVGATTSTATAAMTVLEPYQDKHHVARVAVAANFGGVAIGILASGLLVEYAPLPTRLVYLVLIAASAVGIAAIALTKDPVEHRSGRLRVPRIQVPPDRRGPFWISAGGIAACYSIYGLFGALTPTVVRQVLQLTNAAVVATFVAVMFGAAALIQLALAEIRDRRALLLGLPMILAALVPVELALVTASAALLLAGAALLGVGVGLAFMGAVTLIDRVAPDEKRAEILSGFYLAGYLALSVPTIGVAFRSQSVGIRAAGIEFGLVLAVVVAVLALVTWRTPTPPGGGGRVPPGEGVGRHL